MAIAQTISAFYSELNTLTNKFGNVTDGQKVRWVNRAILNRFIDIKALNPSFYRTHASLVNSVDTKDLDFPVDIDRGSQFLLFYDEERVSIIPSADYRVVGDKIHFNYTVSSNTTYYIEYTKEPNRYTATSDTFLETTDVRLLELLQSEVETIRDTFIRQGQFSPQAQAAQLRTNQIS